MKILPIDNNRSKFGARVSSAELDRLVGIANSNDKKNGIAKLYLLLKHLDEMPGDKAEFVNCLKNNQSQLSAFVYMQNPNPYRLVVDGYMVGEGINPYDALYNAVTAKVQITPYIFGKQWRTHRDKTETDIRDFLYRN